MDHQETEDQMVPCLTAPLPEAKELLAACEAADIPAVLARDACCGKGGCGCAPKMQLLVAPDDVPVVAKLLRDRWASLLEREGTAEVSLFVEPAEGEPPCPACGTAAPLVEGACSGCGLQLE